MLSAVSRSMLLRTSSRRLFSMTIIRKNLIQDLYLRELRQNNIDMATLESNPSLQSNIISWKQPIPPTAPSLELDNSTLADYINEPVETLHTTEPVTSIAADNNNINEGTTMQSEEEDWLVLEDLSDNDVEH